jgi:phage tail-like protein
MTLTAYSADADVRGFRVAVSWVWSGLGERPPFRLVRRRRAYPSGPDDGYAVFDTSELFASPDVPWVRVSRVRYLAAGSGAEGGLVEASVAFFHAAPDSSAPAAVELALFDADVASFTRERIDNVTAVVRTLPPPGAWGSVESLEIRRTDGGPATSAGVLTVFRDHVDGATPSRVVWAPAGGTTIGVDFDAAEVAQTTRDVEVVNEREVAVSWSRALRGDGSDLETALSDPGSAPDGALAEDGVLALHEQFSEDSGDWTRSYLVSDVSAAVEQTAYYVLFTQDPAAPGVWTTERGWTVRATPTARYGFPDRLYELLPAVHRYYDEPTPEDRGHGQLRRFLQVYGAGLDYLRSSGESLRSRHDVDEVRDDLLPALGAWIAWPVDLTAPLPSQRSEIRMAPDVYGTVGTLPNIVALATRATGWRCEAKEFVHNLFLTNAPEEVPVRELFEMTHDGTDFGGPVRLTTTSDFDGRPAAVLQPDGSVRLFWHSDRSGRWELWTRIVGGAGETEPAQLDEPSEDEPTPLFSDLSPAVIRAPAAPNDLWLFWESDREGAADVWARVFDGADWGKPLRLTAHEAPDRRPSVAVGPGDTLWLVWESERRGSSEIWSSVYDGAVWSPAVRLTEGLGQDREPAAALAADGRLWLVWRRDESGRSRLYNRVLDGGAWGELTPLEDGPWRDESPALARRGSDLWLLWSSDRTGRWELWGRVHDGADWGEPFQITMRPDPDKEPALVVDGTDLRVYWRAGRIANEYRSRTVDTTDIKGLEQRGLFADRLHYTYDTARSDVDWYALDAAGIFVTPPRGTPNAVVDEVLDRARTYLDPFCPATVRLVVIPARKPESADFFTDGTDVVDAAVDTFEDQIE